MTSHSHHSSESDRESIKTLLKQLAQDFQSLSYRQLQNESQLKELKLAKERDENNKSKKSSHASSSRGDESFGEQNIRLITIINHPLGELEEKDKKRRLG